MATQLTPTSGLPNPLGQPETNPPTNAQTDNAVMGFFEHLEELRKRLFRAVIGLAIGAVIAIIIANPVITFIAASSGLKLIAISPTENLTVFLRVTVMLGAIFASPFITYQLLLFILPGLTSGERRVVLTAIPAITALFLIGIVFTWLVLLPAYVNYLSNFQAGVIQASWTEDNYFSFVTTVLFWHGAAFETPAVFFLLGRLGIITWKQMLKYWRHSIVAAAAFAGFIAPTYDPLTMIVITVLLFGLYMFSVLLVRFGVPARKI
jgi:sec-independent protein translocase protein TatC